MTAFHRELLTENRVDIVNDLLVDDVITDLLSNLVLDDDDTELIRAEKSSKRQAEKLLDMLVTKGDRAFGHFVEALRNPYPHLVELLSSDSENVRKMSFVGDVQDIGKSDMYDHGTNGFPLMNNLH